MISLLEVVQKTTAFLAGKGVEQPRLNAELLIGHALGRKRMQLYMEFERLLAEAELERIRPLVRRRANREPLQHIVGTVDFAGLVLKVDRRALVPRPETELLVERVIQTWGEPHPTAFADLGTGGGAILLALAQAWPEAAGVGVDLSAEALALARENAEALALAARVTLRCADWFEGLEGKRDWDVIVSNPPYLTAAEVAEAEPEVRQYDPPQALSTAADGMDALRHLVSGALLHLRPGGLLALETGIGQHGELGAALTAAGYVAVESKTDLTGRDRYLLARRSQAN